MSFPVKSKYPPGLIISNGKKYAIGGQRWIEVPMNTTLETVSQYLVYERPARTVELFSVEGSRGNMYEVRHNLENDGWFCTCPGSRFHGKHCKHIKGIINAKST